MKTLYLLFCLVGCTSAAQDHPVLHATERPIVMIGDSITFYWDDPAWQTNSADLISARLNDVVDVGIGGQTCEQMLARFDADVLSRNPAVIYLECGTNDAGQLHSTDTSAFFAMIEKAQASGAQVIVGNLPPDAFPDYVAGGLEPLFALWRTRILAGAKTYDYQVANYYPAMLLDGQQNPALFHSDNTHPTSLGYAVMWNVLEPLIPAEYLAFTKVPTHEE
jgi:lysophospholipase L1-like esterase